jgi:hypothetical protein
VLAAGVRKSILLDSIEDVYTFININKNKHISVANGDTKLVKTNYDDNGDLYVRYQPIWKRKREELVQWSVIAIPIMLLNLPNMFSDLVQLGLTLNE